MSDDEARILARHLIDAWPNGPKGYIWQELVKPLDHETALAAYTRLLRDDAHTTVPTTGRFMAHYRAVHRAAHPPDTSHHIGGQTISRSEYLARLTARADAGDADAVAELERWSRLIRRVDR